MNEKVKLNVILLKTNDQFSKNCDENSMSGDKYVEYLNKEEHKVLINKVEQINLLNFELINLDELSLMLNNAFSFTNKSMKETRYKSLILTSKQTIDAIDNSLKKLTELTEFDLKNCDNLKNNLENFDSITISPSKNKLIVYCVGDATASKFRELLAKSASKFNINKNLIEIKQTVKQKNAESSKHMQNSFQLAGLIIEDFNKWKASDSFTPSKTYALYPCSSIRKDDLNNELTKAKVSFDELHVYKTTYSETSLLSLNQALKEFKKDELSSNHLNCIVFFSPSGVESIFQNETSSKLATIILENKNFYRFISIGPTTSSKLKQFLPNDIVIYELCEPSPTSLMNTLSNLSV